MAKHPTDGRRAALCDWLTANGINPNHVPADADMTIDKGPTGRFLRCEVFDVGPDGRQQLDERGERVAVLIVNVPLAVEPPAWFEPYEKPTRETLLAAVDRVRKLHENDGGICSACTAAIAVLYPCPTVRALDGEEQPGPGLAAVNAALRQAKADGITHLNARTEQP
jgi:hypothetical protein